MTPTSSTHPLQRARFQRVSRWLLALAWLLAFTGTHIPLEKMPPTGTSDLTLHIAGYSILGLALVGTLWAHQVPALRRIGLTAAILAVYGALDELTQPFVNRHANIEDWFGNVIGIVVAITVFELLVRPALLNLHKSR